MLGMKSGYDVFLGGTWNNTTWRNEFINLMKEVNPKIRLFNPIVENWTQDCIDLENFVKAHAVYHIYVITPKMTGSYSIAEMIDSVHDKSKKVYIHIMDHDIDDNGEEVKWDPSVRNSLTAVSNMVVSHGGIATSSISEMVEKIDKDYRSTPIPRNTSRGVFGIINDNT